MASGEMIGAIAMTARDRLSLQSVKTKAILDGDEYVITGAKTFITNGQQADLVIVVARQIQVRAPPYLMTSPKPSTRIPARQGPRQNRPTRTRHLELFFDDVRFPARTSWARPRVRVSFS